MRTKLLILLSILLMNQCTSKNLVIDGNFKDWDRVPASRLAQASAGDKAKYKDLYNVKFCADSTYIYFYLEFNGGTEVLNIEGEDVTRDVAWAIDFFMNVDGSSQTGGRDWLFKDAGSDILIEGSWTDNFSRAGIHVFPHDADQNSWAWQDANIEGSTMCCDPVILPNGHKAVEGKISIDKLPIAIQKLRIGVLCSNAGWTLNGLLPQAEEESDGADVVSEMLDVPMLQ